MAQDGEVVGTITLAAAAVIFAKGHIQHPVHTVFDAPVTAYCLTKLGCITGQSGDVVTRFLANIIANASLCLDHANALQTGPHSLGVKKLQEVGFRDGPMSANFNPSVPPIDCLVKVVGDILKADFLCVDKQVLYILMQGALIPFDG